MSAPILAAEHLSKSFGGVRALEDVSLDLVEGEIHAIVGENGAGKSTFVRLLAGELTPDRGSIRAQAGRTIAMVHQHFMLVPAFTAAENLTFGTVKGGLFISPVSECAPALKIADSLGWKIDPMAKVSSMSVGERQRLEILRALAVNPDILILDEPSAVLAPSEVEELLGILRRLKAQGKTILLIAHKLDEVLAVADRISVLRSGGLVGTYERAAVDAMSLASQMLGEDQESIGAPSKGSTGPVAVLMEDFSVLGDEGNLAISGISETIRQGEVLGIGGVDGNGQVELAEAVAGIRRHTGCIRFEFSTDVAYIPQDRQRDGLALNLTVLDNFAIEGHRRFTRGPFVDLARLRLWAKAIVARLRIRSAHLDALAQTLSGGNQQKIVVGRVLDGNPDLIVAVNPTRGLDVRASKDVLLAIRQRAEAGSAVLLISTDRDELASLAGRTKYLGRGRLYEDFESALAGGQA